MYLYYFEKICKIKADNCYEKNWINSWSNIKAGYIYLVWLETNIA